MAFVITDPCTGCLHAECTRVCPMDCIHGPIPLADIEAVVPEQRPTRFAGMQLYIDPAGCIDCGACAQECPEEAIFEEGDVPAKWSDAIERNAAFFRR